MNSEKRNPPGAIGDRVVVCAIKEGAGENRVIGSLCVKPEHSLLAEIVMGVLSPRVERFSVPPLEGWRGVP